MVSFTGYLLAFVTIPVLLLNAPPSCAAAVSDAASSATAAKFTMVMARMIFSL
jgi:hypothetical protein